MTDFVIKEWDLQPHRGDQAPPHVHHGSDEAFYVLAGELEVLLGDERRIFGAGELAYVPAGTVHTFANRGPGSTRVLAVMTPEIDALITALHDPESDATAIWARYNASVINVEDSPIVPDLPPFRTRGFFKVFLACCTGRMC